MLSSNPRNALRVPGHGRFPGERSGGVDKDAYLTLDIVSHRQCHPAKISRLATQGSKTLGYGSPVTRKHVLRLQYAENGELNQIGAPQMFSERLEAEVL